MDAHRESVMTETNTNKTNNRRITLPGLTTTLQMMQILTFIFAAFFWWHQTESRLLVLEKNVQQLIESNKLLVQSSHQAEINGAMLGVIVDELKRRLPDRP